MRVRVCRAEVWYAGIEAVLSPLTEQGTPLRVLRSPPRGLSHASPRQPLAAPCAVANSGQGVRCLPALGGSVELSVRLLPIVYGGLWLVSEAALYRERSVYSRISLKEPGYFKFAARD